MTVQQIVDFILPIAGRLLLAFAIVLLGRALAGVARRFARRMLEQSKVQRALGPTIVRIFYSLVYYSVLAAAVALALLVLGVPANYLITVTAVVLVVLGLAMQQSLSNFAATIIFLVFQPFKIDEDVETMGQMGTVQEVQLFNTVLLLADKRLVTLPNSKIQESGVVNYTRMGVLRADANLTVAYGEDLGRVQAVLADILTAEPRGLADPPFEIWVQELAEDGVALAARIYVKSEDYWDVLSDLRGQIKTRFDAEGIAFALPQRHVRLTASSVDRNGSAPLS